MVRCQVAFAVLADEMSTPGDQPPASDATGTVRVVPSPDGLPERIEVGAQWRRAVGVEGFAAAVTEACRNAAQSHSAGIGAAMDRAGWRERYVDTLNYIAGAGPMPADLPPVVSSAPDPTPASGSRSASQIVAGLDAISDAIGSGDEGLRRLAEEHTGTGGFGHVSLTLTASGVLTCDADPRWLGNQEAHDLDDALAAALASVRAARDAAHATRATLLSTQSELIAALRASGAAL